MLNDDVILQSTKREIEDLTKNEIVYLATKYCGEQLAKRIKSHFEIE